MAFDESDIKHEDIVYAAGFLDGESHVAVKKSFTSRNPNWSTHYRIYVSVANTYKPVIEWFKMKFGGSIKFTARAKDTKHKDCYSWVISAKAAYLFLKLVKPYLIVKKEQADFCMSFQNTVQKTGFKLDKETLNKRDELYHAVKQLNKRGSNGI